MVFFNFLLFSGACNTLLKEMVFLKLISFKVKRYLIFSLILYFIFLIFNVKSLGFPILFFLFPCLFLLFLLIFLKKHEEKSFLFSVYSFLIPLESQMKLGQSFTNAWHNSLEDLESSKTKNKFQKISEILKFQKEFHFHNKKIENIINDLIIIYNSSNPLQRLRHLQRKIKVERTFQIKSKRVLLQIRIQSGILSFFYFSLLAWTVYFYGKKYLYLELFSFVFFIIGLFWIFKTGRRMRWSI